ncbi:MAG TPA: hypothetical protein VL551_11765 [Actinospica sp.]|jgi:hypothetical protein|nr:hypothetical protein [Actinospica sp.]
MTTIANDQPGEPADPGLIDLARVIAEKYEYSEQENLQEADSWDREAELHVHVPGYSNWASRYAEVFRRHAREDKQVAERSSRYIERARSAANSRPAG